MASIGLGLSLAIFVEGLARVARETERVDGRLFHTAWGLALFLTHFFVWWTIWDYREVAWTFPRFFVVGGTPLILLFLASLLFPSRTEASAVDLEGWFFSIRRPFMGGYVALNIVFVLDGPLVFASEPLWIAYRVPQLLALAAAVGGYLTAHRGWHVLFAWTMLLLAAGVNLTHPAGEDRTPGS